MRDGQRHAVTEPAGRITKAAVCDGGHRWQLTAAPARDSIDGFPRDVVREIASKLRVIFRGSTLGIALKSFADDLWINARIHDLGRRLPDEDACIVLAEVAAIGVVELAAAAVW